MLISFNCVDFWFIVGLLRDFRFLGIAFFFFFYLVDRSVTSMDIASQHDRWSITLRSPSQRFWPFARRIISEFVPFRRSRAIADSSIIQRVHERETRKQGEKKREPTLLYVYSTTRKRSSCLYKLSQTQRFKRHSSAYDWISIFQIPTDNAYSSRLSGASERKKICSKSVHKTKLWSRRY